MDGMIRELEIAVINTNEINRYITDVTHHSSMILNTLMRKSLPQFFISRLHKPVKGRKIVRAVKSMWVSSVKTTLQSNSNKSGSVTCIIPFHCVFLTLPVGLLIQFGRNAVYSVTNLPSKNWSEMLLYLFVRQ